MTDADEKARMFWIVICAYAPTNLKAFASAHEASNYAFKAVADHREKKFEIFNVIEFAKYDRVVRELAQTRDDAADRETRLMAERDKALAALEFYSHAVTKGLVEVNDILRMNDLEFNERDIRQSDIGANVAENSPPAGTKVKGTSDMSPDRDGEREFTADEFKDIVTRQDMADYCNRRVREWIERARKLVDT